jgi:hypothetical protein
MNRRNFILSLLTSPAGINYKQVLCPDINLDAWGIEIYIGGEKLGGPILSKYIQFDGVNDSISIFN